MDEQSSAIQDFRYKYQLEIPDIKKTLLTIKKIHFKGFHLMQAISLCLALNFGIDYYLKLIGNSNIANGSDIRFKLFCFFGFLWSVCGLYDLFVHTMLNDSKKRIAKITKEYETIIMSCMLGNDRLKLECSPNFICGSMIINNPSKRDIDNLITIIDKYNELLINKNFTETVYFRKHIKSVFSKNTQDIKLCQIQFYHNIFSVSVLENDISSSFFDLIDDARNNLKNTSNDIVNLLFENGTIKLLIPKTDGKIVQFSIGKV